MGDFYTYVYLDPRKPGNYKYGDYAFEYEPFYIGKGCKNRLNHHIKEYNNYNSYKFNKIKAISNCGLKSIIIKIHKQVSEKYAFEKEIELIKLIGRYDLGLGPLTNLTYGGEGVKGRKDSIKQLKTKSNISKKLWNNPEYRRKITEANSGENNPFYNKKHSDETRENLSKKAQNRSYNNRKKLGWNKNGTISNEQKAQISKTLKELNHTTKPIKVYAYAIDKTLFKIFNCKSEVKNELNMITRTLNKYINSGKIYKGCYFYDYEI